MPAKATILFGLATTLGAGTYGVSQVTTDPCNDRNVVSAHIDSDAAERFLKGYCQDKGGYHPQGETRTATISEGPSY